jgi:hypothetical protein
MEQEILEKGSIQNGTPKNEIPPSDITQEIYKQDDKGEIKELKVIRENFKSYYKKQNENQSENQNEKEKSPSLCFFFQALDVNILMNLPNVQGINISIGLEKGKEVLILVPVIKASPAQNVYSQTFIVNGTETTTSTVVKLPPSPCPPYPHGSTSCP